MFQEMREWSHRLKWMKMDSKIVKFGDKEKLIFLYKIVEGLSQKSFAINVAQIAGLPEFIIQSASRHLSELQSNRANSN